MRAVDRTLAARSLLDPSVRSAWRHIASKAGLVLDIIHSRVHASADPSGALPRRIAGGWSIRYPDGSEYTVFSRANRLLVELPDQDGSEEIHLRLAGPVTAMVMACCGFFPLHAAGFRFPEGIAAVFAPPGGGKSTLAAIAAGQGTEILGDDLLALTRTAHVLPLTGSLRITASEAPAGWHPAFTLSDGRGWYTLPTPPPDSRINSLVLLTRGQSIALDPVRGHRRLSGLLAAGFLSRFDPAPDALWHDQILDLTATLPVWELVVPEGLARLRESWPEIRRLLAESCV